MTHRACNTNCMNSSVSFKDMTRVVAIHSRSLCFIPPVMFQNPSEVIANRIGQKLPFGALGI